MQTLLLERELRVLLIVLRTDRDFEFPLAKFLVYGSDRIGFGRQALEREAAVLSDAAGISALQFGFFSRRRRHRNRL